MQTTQGDAPPSRRTGTLDPHAYTVAWIAPLEIEAQAALHLLDVRHLGRFPVGRGDDYVFHAGSMLGHNIVIATLPAGQEYGTGSAAALASQVKKFFPNLWFGLLVGVAAGLPDLSRTPTRDIRLGDVLVGLGGENPGLVAYDLGKETEDGFEPLRHGHVLAVTETIIRSAIGSIKLKAPYDFEEFLPFYETLRDKEHATGGFVDPGQERDRLYYTDDDGTDRLVERVRRPDSRRTRVWYGPIGSGEKLLRNAQKRNELRDKYDVIGVEMEAAGAMNRIPVGVIRGVCDYADKHKNKEWQPYAAAMAAAYGKAVLNEIPPRDLGPSDPSRQTGAGNAAELDRSFHKPCYHIQLAKNTRFTGRTAVLNELEEKLFGQEPCERAALVGLGGVGKTQIALHLAYKVKKERPEYSIFWVPIISGSSAQQAYVDMARKLGLEKKSDDEDIRELVCRHLSSAEAGKWLLIVDNADDQELVFGSTEGGGIEEFLPRSDQGFILMTTRSRQVAVDFAQADVVDIEQMSREEATQLLGKSLPQKQMLHDEALMTELLDYLTCLPLAITQAAAYLNRTKAPVHKYLSLLRGAEKDIPSVLGQEFRDNTRYAESRNAVATTWLVSFDQIEKSNELAVKLLSFMSYIEPKAIPQSILPGLGPGQKPESDELEWAIGELCGYSFIVRREDSDMFDMHSLVHMAMRAWTENRDRTAQTVQNAVFHVAHIFPSHSHASRQLWREYMPHALRLLYGGEGGAADQHRYRLLSRVGRCLEEDRRFKEAVQCFEEVCEWEGQQELLTVDSKMASMHWLAGAYLSDRQFKKAIEILEHVTKVDKDTLDEKDPGRLDSEHRLAQAYLQDRQTKKAIETLEHILIVERKNLDETDYNRWTSEKVLAQAYLDNRQTKKAIELLEQVVATRKETLDEPDSRQVASEYELAKAYLEDEQTKKAIEMLEHIRTIKEETLDEKDHHRLASEQTLARAYLQDGQAKKAIEIFKLVVMIRRETLDERDYDRLESEHELARAYLKDKQAKKAIEILKHVVMLKNETWDEKDPNRLASMHKLAEAQLQDGLAREAINHLEHVVAIESQLYAEDDPERQVSVELLARARKQLETGQDISEDDSEASGRGQELEHRQVDIATSSASVDDLTKALDRLQM